ncbi:inositol monophosphatase [Methylocapsa sp. S129]|uniref:inositol monophosphatase family protein n=1 Tax=Methylocapsa sp. S129 TaxID=1641869 RepID=UPI00131BAC52|nr:inositol monophosphatase [Methylocapsa sp. S129]
MDAASLQHRFAFASGLIEEAGALALGYFRDLGSLHVESKGQQDMASEADVNTEILIRDRLKQMFPEDGFLGEETGRDDLQAFEAIWVVDPIDGTQPFVSGMSGWCVSIALVVNGVLEMGFVSSPARDELFIGRRGGQATLNGKPIRVSGASRLDDGIVGVGYSPRVRPDAFLPLFSRLLREGAMFYRDGSGALTLCYIACGRLIGYVEPHINSWDCLGALAIIEAAGGKVSDFLAEDGLWKGNRLIAGPPSLYPALLALFDEAR